MSRVQILPIEFYDTSKEPGKEGLKFALCRLDMEDKVFSYEWAFANFENGQWEDLSQNGITVSVYKWGELPSPQLLF